MRHGRPALVSAAAHACATLAIATFVLGSFVTRAAAQASSATTKPVSASSKPATTTTRHTPAATKPAAPRPATARRATSAAKPKGTASAQRLPPGALARQIRSLEELGGYGQAADRLGALRDEVPSDADLDLALALNLARSGRVDSAAHLLESPLLSAALRDTADANKFHIYGWRHERAYLDGRFNGWYWYVARSRAEVNARLGQWDRALEAARICTQARPLAGTEWHIRALCAARAGAWDEAHESSDHALRLNPTLPEAQYLQGLFDWRSGQRHLAQQRFRAAIDLDSTYGAPALALVRSRLAVPPDTLPDRLLEGVRATALLTSRARPKYDEFDEVDVSATIVKNPSVVIPDSLRNQAKAFTAQPIALVDERGRIALTQDQWIAAGKLPEGMVGAIMERLRDWQFSPAMIGGRPVPLWLEVDVPVEP